MSLILFPIFIMVILNIFSMVISGGWFGDYPYGGQTFFIAQDMWGAVIGIGALMGLALLGTQILGSGLSGESVRIILLGVFYIGLWVMLSLGTFTMITSIEYFGGYLYAGLSIFYLVGVGYSIAGSGGEA